MMFLEQIEKDLIEAVKSQDETAVNTLRLLKSAIHNWQIANQKEPQDADVLSVIQKEIKSRQDSIAMYHKGGREELAAKEEKEIGILKKYLPAPLAEAEIRQKIKEVIAEVKATGPQDMGKVMGPVMGQLKGRADGALVARLVKEELS
jgi:uncharacterized protein YqeY